MLFQLEKPGKFTVDGLTKALKANIITKTEIHAFIRKAFEPEYLYWDKFRHKEPSPKAVSKEELWVVVKVIRDLQKLKSPIKDQDGEPFTWFKMNYFEEFFHELDMRTGGELFAGKGELTNVNKQKFISHGIIEEAIASSQLEGAATSRQTAKKMLREGRKPRNSSEQMIVNSYLAMKSIEEEYKNKEMSIDLLLELHTIITKKTADSENEKPRMRKKGEAIYISDSRFIYHEGPDIDFVKNELASLIRFANDDLETGVFIHPIIKAIMLHFWMGYLHPFTDGNGRLARLLFYWYLIKNGYWAFVYLPISKVIKRSPSQYIMAYVYSEQDDNDLTYFIDYNLKKIKLAMKDFAEYLEKQANKNSQMKKKAESKYDLNPRQVCLLQYLHGDADTYTTLLTHMNINQITRMTATRDLKDLVRKNFLTSKKQGRNVYYFGTAKISELF